MAVNPYDYGFIQKLGGAVSASVKLMQPFREHRYSALREFVGSHYSDDGASDKVPVNYLSMATMIYARQLAAAPPRALCTTDKPNLKSGAAKLEVDLNNTIEKIDLGESIFTSLIDSIFSVGCMKVGLRSTQTLDFEGSQYDVGEPFAEPIDLDDLVLDMTARRLSEMAFVGNRYRVTLDYVRKSPVFNENARKKVSASEITLYNAGGDERAETLSQGTDAIGTDELRDTVELYDIWLPEENLVCTFQADTSAEAGDSFFGEPLRVVEWNGPENGPYHLLWFMPVPRNIMPKSPISDLIDLHDLTNRLWRKLGRQAERQKTLFGYMGGTEDDARRIKDARDGEAIKFDNPDKVKEFATGGIHAPNLAFAIQAGEVAKMMAGNLDLLGGLGPQSGTLGQDEILAKSANKMIAHMQDRLIRFAGNIIKDLAFYTYTDPLLDRPVIQTIRGTTLQVRSRLRADTLRGRFTDYQIKIEPYSMMHRSPGMRLQTIQQFIMQFIAPFAPMLEQQGIKIDFQEIAKIWAKYTDMVELSDILILPSAGQINQQPQGNQGSERPRQSPMTHRTNERINRPGATTHGNADIMSRLLLNPDSVQGSEASALMRATG